MKILLLITCLFLSGCTTPAHTQLANKLMNSFTKQMNKENLFLLASGGSMMDDIQEISLDYGSYRILNIEEARMFFISKVEALLKEINESQKARPYLHNFPFTSRNVHLTISFYYPNGDWVDSPHIALVSLLNNKNKVAYVIYDKNLQRYETIYEETYEEALQIYNETIGCSAQRF